MSENIMNLPLIPLRGISVFPKMVIHFDIGREKSKAAIEAAVENQSEIFLVSQIDYEIDDPTFEDIYSIGTICKIKQIIKLPNEIIRVLVEGRDRGELRAFVSEDKYLEAELERIKEPSNGECENIEAYINTLKKSFKRYIRVSSNTSSSLMTIFDSISNYSELTDIVASYVLFDENKRQEILQELDVIKRIEKLLIFIEKEIEKHETEFVYGKGKHKTKLQKFYELLVEYKEKLNEYKEHLEIMGPNRNSYSRTDKGATFMRMKDDHMRNSQLKPGYNIQIGVSDEYILHMDISSERNDYKTLIPFLEGYKDNYGKYPQYPVGDSGYGGLINYRYMKLNDMELYTKYNMYEKDTKDKKRIKDPYQALNLVKDEDNNFIDPGGGILKYLYHNKRGNDVYYVPSLDKNKEINEELISYQKEAIKNLTSELGIELRIQRSIQVEGAFGVIKDVFKLRRFRRTLTENVKLEFLLVAIGYNLAKYHNKRYRIIN